MKKNYLKVLFLTAAVALCTGISAYAVGIPVVNQVPGRIMWVDVKLGQMQIKLEQVKAIWFQAVTEARANPTKEQVLRAYAAQYSAMEGANEIATLAIRTCGGQAMLKSLPLERIYRDSRCGSLMLP